MKNYYDVLQISPESELIDIKRAYRKLALKYHPDRNKAKDAAKLFIEIHEAYQVLSDPQKRCKYDTYLNFKKSQSETKFKEEIIIFNEESSNLGKEKASQYSQMSYEDFRKTILREIGLKASYFPHVVTMIMVAIFFIACFIGSLISFFQKSYFYGFYGLLLSFGLIAILKKLYQNFKIEYTIDKQNLYTKKK